MIRVAVVARGNEVAEARLLAASLAEHHPGWAMTLLVLPGLRPGLRREGEPFEVVTPDVLAHPGVGRLLLASTPQAAAGLVRPLLVEHLLEQGAERVVLLPADARVHAPLEPLVAEAPVVLVPRVLGALPEDGRRPDATDLLDAGEIEDELLAVRAGDEARDVLDWWVERALETAEAAAAVKTHRSEPPRRLSASPLGLASRTFSSVAVLDDPGVGVSYWNLHERPLARDGEALTAAGAPLRLMRWAGFRADRPWWLSEHATRTLVLDDPVLSELAGERAAALRDAGWLDMGGLAAARDELGNGLIYDERLRRLEAEAIDAGEQFGDLFSPSGAEAFESWLREPAPHGALAGINRYAYDVWRHRTDVQEAYPDLDGNDAEGFVGWLWVHGRPELRLQEPLLPPAPDWVEQAVRRVPAVLVTGYLRGNLGLGEAARGYVNALQAGGVPIATRSVSTDPPVDRLPRGARQRPDERAFDELGLPEGVEPEVHLLCVNADQTPEFAEQFGPEELERSHVIGHWAWETDVIPSWWDRGFDLVDELWVNSTYVAENIGRAADVPVVVVPTPIEPPDTGDGSVPFELPEGFLFLFAFDFFSTVARKNPEAVVEAFKRAFAPGEGPSLLLKTINAEFRPEAHERLRHAIGDRPDIRLVDTTLAPAEMAALFARADCYVSLHRSEGYGITLAEAMALGKPVIGTGYSGNTDFMTPANSYLVDCELVPVGPDAEHYPADGTWAEPSVEHAAALMREVHGDQETARARGARARADIAATLSTRAVGAIARARLERIAQRRAGTSGSGELPYPLDEVGRRLHFDLGGGEGARGKLKGAVWRVLRPYALRQRALDEAIDASLRRLYTELEAERAGRARDRARLARLERRR